MIMAGASILGRHKQCFISSLMMSPLANNMEFIWCRSHCMQLLLGSVKSTLSTQKEICDSTKKMYQRCKPSSTVLRRKPDFQCVRAPWTAHASISLYHQSSTLITTTTKCDTTCYSKDSDEGWPGTCYIEEAMVYWLEEQLWDQQ